MRGWFDWMALGPFGAWEGGGCGYELGGSGSQFHGNIPNKKPQTDFIWVPSGLNHSVMGKTEASGHRICSGVGVCGSRRPRWRGCGSRGGVWLQRYSKWSISSGMTRAGGVGFIGCCRCGGILSGSRRETCHMVGIPCYKITLARGH